MYMKVFHLGKVQEVIDC